VNDALTMRICRELKGRPERKFSPKAIVVMRQFGCSFIQYSSFSYLSPANFDRFLLRLPRYPSDMTMLIEIIWQAPQVNVLSASLKKKGYEFPMKVGVFSCESGFDAKNLLKSFELHYTLESYEELRSMFDPHGYAHDVL
jgi:hypothetical protein